MYRKGILSWSTTRVIIYDRSKISTYYCFLYDIIKLYFNFQEKSELSSVIKVEIKYNLKVR